MFLLLALIVVANPKIGIRDREATCLLCRVIKAIISCFSSFQALNCISNLRIYFELWEMGENSKKHKLDCEMELWWHQCSVSHGKNLILNYGKKRRLLRKPTRNEALFSSSSHIFAEEKKQRTPMSGWIRQLEFTHRWWWGGHKLDSSRCKHLNSSSS